MSKTVWNISLVATLGLVASALGLFREMCFAWRLGTSAAMDAYVAATFVPRVVLAALLGAALPSFTAIYCRQKPMDSDGAGRFASSAIGVSLLLCALICTLLAPTARVWLGWLYPGFGGPTRELAVTATLIILPLASGQLVAGLLTGALNAVKEFALPSLMPALGTLIVVGVLLASRSDNAFYPVCAATGVSFVLPCLIQYRALCRRAPNIRLARPKLEPPLMEWMWAMVPLLAYQAVAFAANIWEANVASRMGVGSLSSLNYAARVTTLPGTLIAMPIATVLLPWLTDRAASQSSGEIATTISATIRGTLFLFAPAAVILLVAAQPITNLLLLRGAFSDAAAVTTGAAVQAGALGTLANAASIILLRAYYATNDYRGPLICEAASLAIYLPLALVLSRLGGVAGLSGARAISFWATFALLSLRLVRKFKCQGVARHAAIFVFILGAAMSVAIAVGIWADHRVAQMIGADVHVARLAVGAVVVTLVYLGSALAFGLVEAQRAVAAIADIVRASGRAIRLSGPTV